MEGIFFMRDINFLEKKKKNNKIMFCYLISEKIPC